ncbi:MAG TPA: AmmeMemoRadiSam system protein A [Micromonosporaceae bacterium]|nr:AmmeMemoRadiSam system protein A [Micromonosporaceae bacterium]
MIWGLLPEDSVTVARLARDAIGAVLSGRSAPDGPPADSRLWEPGASFVTIDRAGALRGCVGTVLASRPLCLDVIHNAEGATRDPRLPPVTRAEWPDLDVKVSVLGPLEPVPVGGCDELAAALRPGVDGVLLTDGTRRATFLPAVWHKVDDPVRFVRALLAKGGWPPDAWPDGMQVSRYSCVEYVDRGPRAALPG